MKDNRPYSAAYICVACLAYLFMPGIGFAQNICEQLPYFTNLPNMEAGEKWWPPACRENAVGTADYDFYEGRLALVRDDAIAAEKHFRDALSKEPDHAGARVYLGLSLVQQGRSSAGAYHYRLAVVEDLPQPVSASLREFIEEEASPLGFNGYGYVNVNRRSNPFLDSGITSVNVGEYIFYREAGDIPQTVIEAGGTLSYRFPLMGTSALFMQLGLAADYYTRTDDLELSVIPRAAFEFNLSEQISVSAGVQAEQIYFNGDLFERGIGPRLTLDYSISDRTYLWAVYTHQSIDRPEDDSRDGNTDEINLGLNRVETPRWVNYYNLSLKSYDYQTERLGFTDGRVRVTTQYLFNKGIRGELSTMLGGRKYHGVSNIFAKTREELLYSASIAVGKNSIQWKGVSPQIRIEYKGRDSNVDLYDYNDFGVSLELSRDF